MSGPAFRVDGGQVTQQAFYAAACDPKRSVVVEACAGAGKTWMLVSRILRALLDGAEPNEILAITFTRKAAGEMRSRLNEWLAEFSSSASSDDARIEALQQRGLSAAEARAKAPALAGLRERLLRSGRSVDVRTFHAWFSQLMRAAPLELLGELGLHREMELVEDVSAHAAAIYRRFHAAVAVDADLRADFDALVHARGRSQLRKWLGAALERRVEIQLADGAGVLDDSVPPVDTHWPALKGLAHPAERIRHDAVLAHLGALARALVLHKGAVAKRQGARLAEALGIEPHTPCLAAVRAALLTEKGALRKALVAPGLAEAAAVLEDIAQACRQREARLDHLRMVRLTRCLFAEFALYKRLNGLADMSDLERCALALLRDSSLAGWVQERLDARIRHVLIDEFQDTSPLQWQALEAWLSAYAGAGGGASGQRPPGVFIVGDPKQSIYRFRRAEPRVFDAARDFVRQGLDGRVLACDHTRRNAPAVIAALNHVFDEAQLRGEFAGFRAHTTEVEGSASADAIRRLPRVERPEKTASVFGDVEVWRDTLRVPRHEPEEVLRQREAAAVAQAIRVLVVYDGVPPGDIQVLCRKRETLRLVADELAALHLPFAAAEDFALMEAIEARDLVALLDVLASPQHRLSLAHALRSPVFGASDDDLIALAHAAEPHGDWWRALMKDVVDRPALTRARELLARWQPAAARLPPHDLLDIVLAEGDVVARYAAAVPPERRQAALAAIDALVAQSLALDGGRYATPYNFVRALKRRPIKVAAPAQPHAVQLLTVHGAKGLEARVVFVVDSDPTLKTPENATLLIDWPVDMQHPACCAFVYSEAQCPPSLVPLLERERIARRREELNGLYVAMSRAKAQLVFSCTAPHRAAAESASWWQRVEPIAVPWEPEAAPTGDAALGAIAVVRDLPAWAPRPQSDRSANVAATAQDDVRRLGEAVHRVLEWAASPNPPDPDIAAFAVAAADEFGVDSAVVARLAGTIWHSPACAPFLRGPRIRWSGNEVGLSHAGEALRVDRLVSMERDGVVQWWVLDYKLQNRPADVASYREQMSRYRSAVQALRPGETVRSAFITGSGELIEIE